MAIVKYEDQGSYISNLSTCSIVALQWTVICSTSIILDLKKCKLLKNYQNSDPELVLELTLILQELMLVHGPWFLDSLISGDNEAHMLVSPENTNRTPC